MNRRHESGRRHHAADQHGAGQPGHPLAPFHARQQQIDRHQSEGGEDVGRNPAQNSPTSQDRQKSTRERRQDRQDRRGFGGTRQRLLKSQGVGRLFQSAVNWDRSNSVGGGLAQ